MYKGNLGLLAKDHEIEQLKEYFTQSRPESFEKFEEIHFGIAIDMVNKAKELAMLDQMQKDAEEKKEETQQENVEDTAKEETQKKPVGRPKRNA